jgi:hypothetical protein
VCSDDQQPRGLKNFKPTEPNILVWATGDGEHPQRVDDANVWTDIRAPVEQVDSQHTALDINQLSLTNDRRTDGRPETNKGLKKVLYNLNSIRESTAVLKETFEDVSFPPRFDTNELMFRFKQVEKGFNEMVKKVSYTPRCNTNMAHELMSGFDQPEKYDEELSERLDKVSFLGFEKVEMGIGERLKKLVYLQDAILTN